MDPANIHKINNQKNKKSKSLIEALYESSLSKTSWSNGTPCSRMLTGKRIFDIGRPIISSTQQK